MSGVENSRPGLKYEYATTGAMSDTVPGNGGDQGVTPVVGVVVLVAVTVVLAVSISAALTTPETAVTPSAPLSLTVDSKSNDSMLTHRGGDTLEVSELNIRIEVDGTALAEQPPVPFVGADGFDGTPTGPFNAESPDEWRAGERAGVRLAGTNTPPLSADSEVTVVVATDSGVIQEITTTVKNTYAIGTVTRSRACIDGPLGQIGTGATVETSYAAGTVTGGSNVGGLTGRNFLQW